MKNKIKTLGIITLTAVVVLVMTACDDLLGGGFDPPTEVVATLLSSSSVHVTWKAVKGAKGYIIAYRTNLDSTDTRRDAGSSEITTFTHSYYSYVSIDVTTLYYYVKAYKGSYYSSDRVDSDYSSPASVDITN